ncbi:MAG TPA: hypothetical protein VL689_12195 [Paraburkholderia sp.]|jgi:hypothetical protein|nr:hypothetical protein [Paraburkholderia sp.]
MKTKLLAALGLGAIVFATSQAAMAGVSVGLNLGVPAPVYVAPAPVYAPAYYPPVAYRPVVAPAIFVGWHGDRYWDGHRWYGRHEWDGRHGGYGYRRW